MALKGLMIDGRPLETLLQEGVRKGLEKGDAQMARFVAEQLDKEDADESIRELQLEIVPYDIEDASLRTIVLKAPEYVIDEIKAALIERENSSLLDKARRVADEEAESESTDKSSG